MHQSRDHDPLQTREWLESLESVIDVDGLERARFLVASLLEEARTRRVVGELPVITDYVNTLSLEEEAAFPGNEAVEQRIEDMIRWNAAVIVAKGNKDYAGIGGHISTFASSATLYEVGMNWFFRGKEGPGTGDHVYYQGHGAPGMYARSFLEGRLTEAELIRFRREVKRGAGLSSYPHPRLMPNYWEFPTVSMGLGPMAAIYQARFNRYLASRGIVDTEQSRVWAFLGDGESDEPEAAGALCLAGRDGLQNLTFVINCNLQRLDGPVRGNGKIIQELEGLYRGAGWNVVKCTWGREWDPILSRDAGGVLRDALNQVVDGEWQHFASSDGKTLRERFFGQNPALLQLIQGISDDDLGKLRPGGHDRRKVYAAFKAAEDHQGRPTVILSHSVKGWRAGSEFAGKNSTHQKKQIKQNELAELRDILDIPFTDEQLESYPFYHPGERDPALSYLHERRAAMGGPLPSRRTQVPALGPVKDDVYAAFQKGNEQPASTTMAFAQLVSRLLKDKNVGKRIVPIVPDEARTFGMDPLFRQVGIWASNGQKYEPVDKKMLLYYREAADGQLLEEGIPEAGAMSSFLAAGTAGASHGEAMIPFYVFYSMFGFQRTGDQAWAFGDARGRGFLMGATAGRTTLNGEGLQHEDGQSHLLASTIPNLRCYDPAFAYELATIVKDGIRRMYVDGEDTWYYITIQNENYPMPPMPEGSEEGILRGLYRFRPSQENHPLEAQLFGSASILMQVLEAQEILATRFGVAADVWSATSYQLLRNDALRCERWNRLHPTETARVPHVARVLDGVDGPFIAASDYMKAVPDMIARWIPGEYVPLGTDGYGMSDTREALRRHFEVDAASIVVATLDALRHQGKITASELQSAIADLRIDTDKIDPLDV
ncbi:MAG: pyruvate dehydrogenase (acetyl-transferring), homodimeric type [Planctomycetes bacterium]|nr:pyruvate dehydrogenase (acetyl-transferring), homodimeric type [Planctomycetota bacterium]